LDKVTVTFTKA